MKNNLLCSIRNDTHLKKAKIIENDKFIIFGKNGLKLYQFIEDKEKKLYNCIEIGELTLGNTRAKIHNVLYIKKNNMHWG